MPLLARALIQPQDLPALDLRPIHLRADPAIHEPLQRFVANLLLETDILHRGMHQLQQQILFIGFGGGAFRRVPRQLLGRGGSPLAIRTAVPFGAQPEKNFSAKDRQVSEREPLPQPMTLPNLPPTLPTCGPLQGALDREETLAPGGKLDLQYSHVGHIQRNGDLRVDGLALLVSGRSQSFLMF